MFGIKSGNIKLEGMDLDYVVFGKGKTPIVILPGLSDGLKTVKGQGLILAIYYIKYWTNFRVYVFSRKNQLEEGYTTREMAKDQKIAMDALGIKEASVVGISQGGMIAQYLAIDYPDQVCKLILGVTTSRQTDTIQEVVRSWIAMAVKGDYKNLIWDTMKKTYTEKTLRKYKPFYPIITRLGKPKSFTRFIIQANACLTHNAINELGKITCPTLVIGGKEDKVTGKGTSEEMVVVIPNSKLIVYDSLGHGAYEENKEFDEEVRKFLL